MQWLVRGAAAGSIVVAGCTEPGQPIQIPRLIFPRALTVVEGQQLRFDVALADLSEPRASPIIEIHGDLHASPEHFTLTPSEPAVEVAIVAERDADMLDDSSWITFYFPGAIAGESPAAQVRIIDDDRPHLVASAWLVTLVPGATTTVSIQLSEPPSATLVVPLRSTLPAAVDVTPAQLVFEAATFNVPQPITIGRHGDGYFDDGAIWLDAVHHVTPAGITVVAPYVEGQLP